MHGAPFYDEGTSAAQGFRRAVVLARRLLRRLLRPMLFRLDAELKSLDRKYEQLDRRQEHLDRQLKAAIALGWDHVAMARRLAVLEDHVNELLSRSATSASVANGDGASRPSIRYPGHEGRCADEPRPLIASQSKVS
jgi:hypothetical protein